MMRKNNNNRNNNMKHRGGQGGSGGRRYQNNSGGGGNRGGNDSGNIARQKHHATQQLGKYGDMARNAQMSGDRVDVEYYLQHVDHYTRVLTDIAAIEAERHSHQREQQIVPGGPNDPNAQENANSQSSGDHSGNTESGGKNEPAFNNAEGSGEGDAQQQPRHRQPRRQHYSAPASDNGAAEANSNTTDIPLPGGILPPI